MIVRIQFKNSHPEAGWSSLVARRAHNPKVVGSNPAPATTSSLRVIVRIQSKNSHRTQGGAAW